MRQLLGSTSAWALPSLVRADLKSEATTMMITSWASISTPSNSFQADAAPRRGLIQALGRSKCFDCNTTHLTSPDQVALIAPASEIRRRADVLLQLTTH